MTSSRSSGGSRRRSASATAGRSTRSRAACCRCSSGRRPGSSSSTWATRKGYRATVCFGASSTTDDLEGELTPADGAGAGPGCGRGGAAAVPSATIAQRPPAYSAIKVAGRRAYAMARAGETVELAERRVTIDDARRSVTGTRAIRPGRSRSSTSRAPRGPTSGPSPAISARPSAARAYLGALVRTASGPFTIDDAIAARRRPGRGRGGPGAARGPAAADRRRSRGPAGGRPRRGRGRGRRPRPVRADRRAARRVARRRPDPRPRRGRDARRDRPLPRWPLAPDKVLVDAPAPVAARA